VHPSDTSKLSRPSTVLLPPQLKAEWRLWAVAGSLAVAAAFFTLKSHLNLAPGSGAATVGALLYVLALFYFNLKYNHRPEDSRLLPSLGAANRITFLRGLLICILAAFWGWMPLGGFDAGNPRAWWPGMLYITAAVLDGMDGMIARRTHCRTRLGSNLDTQMDAFGLLVAVSVGIRMQQLPPVFLSVGLAYYLFAGAVAWRRKRAKPLNRLRPRPEARAIAGLSMGFVGIALLPVYAAPVTTLAAVLFMLPFCYGFLRDGWVVCGAVRTDADQRTAWDLPLKRLFSGWLPLLCRILLGFTVLSLWVSASARMTAWNHHRPDIWPSPSVPLALAVAQLLCVMMVLTGCLGRSAALGMALILGWGLQRPDVGPDGWALFICSVCVLLAGSGFFSLWQPEDRWLYRNRSPVRRFKLDGRTFF
jgi:CDP-diacylglycerol--glycerol-3-phosphate 3-phosphatidyltransferase